MADLEVREYFIEDPESPHLYIQSWCKKDQTPKGCVLITHGISEHSECYTHVAEAIAEAGWFVFAWDLQGHGKSDGKRGYVKQFTDFADDLYFLIRKIKDNEKIPASQLHLIGHSMGGLITLQCLINHSDLNVTSVTLSNPALGLALEVPKIKEIASQWLNQVWPSLTLGNEVRYDALSRDPAMRERYDKDPLRHNKISAPLYLGMVDAMEQIKKEYGKINTPLFFQVSGKDKIVSPQATLDFYKELAGEKKLKMYPESFHEIYNDLNKDEGIQDMINYIGEFA